MDVELLKTEITYKYVRSSGKGGQHVNKVSTKAELYFDLYGSAALNQLEKHILSDVLSNRVNKVGVMVLACDDFRSQLRNKNEVTLRFLSLLEDGLKEEKERLPTKIPKAVKKKRLNSKRKISEKKANRKPPEID